MIKNKKVLAIIPARGGSKGLPGKNSRELCGKPLIAWTLEKAKKSHYLDMILVTTDCSQIAEIARQFGGYVPFLRPADLATDQASTFDTVFHALEYLKENECHLFDFVVLLEPTSPLREDYDIDRMLEKIALCESDFDSIVSVGEVGQHPSLMKRLVDENVHAFCPDLPLTTRRQDNEPAYFPFGVAYIAKTHELITQKTFYTSRCTYYCIKPYQNFEIDNIYDFLCIENIMKYEWGLK
jgi:CMP-N,N'-diacetyllegionaminic acid synthase